MKSKFLSLLQLLIIFGSLAAESSPEFEKWVVYYGKEGSFQTFQPYSMIVFDNDEHPFLQGFIEEQKMLLGYLSVGEVESFRYYFQEVKQQGLLQGQNKTFTESEFVDLRDPRWAKRIIEELIPSILQQGFQGVFLDTLDNAIYLEEIDPKKFHGMKKAAIELIQGIRLHYPHIKIMVNRAYQLLTAVGGEIDMVLAEGLYSQYDFKTGKYKVNNSKEHEQDVAFLKELQKKFPSLQIFTLDFWNPTDKEMIKKIYTLERGNGFIPYVSTIGLTDIIAEPQ